MSSSNKRVSKLKKKRPRNNHPTQQQLLLEGNYVNTSVSSSGYVNLESDANCSTNHPSLSDTEFQMPLPSQILGLTDTERHCFRSLEDVEPHFFTLPSGDSSDDKQRIRFHPILGDLIFPTRSTSTNNNASHHHSSINDGLSTDDDTGLCERHLQGDGIAIKMEDLHKLMLTNHHSSAIIPAISAPSSIDVHEEEKLLEKKNFKGQVVDIVSPSLGTITIVCEQGATIREAFDMDDGYSNKLCSLGKGSRRKFVEKKFHPAPKDQISLCVGVFRYKICLEESDSLLPGVKQTKKYGWISEKSRLKDNPYQICRVQYNS